jgi:hypothetical protein
MEKEALIAKIKSLGVKVGVDLNSMSVEELEKLYESLKGMKDSQHDW